MYSYLAELADVLKEEQYQNKHRFMVTEAYPENQDSVISYMSTMSAWTLQWPLLSILRVRVWPGRRNHGRTYFKRFHAALMQYDPLCIPSNAFGNHDLPRLITRIGSEGAAVAVMLMTLPGMAFVYYGEEIGMENGHIPPEHVQDPAAKGSRKGGTGRDPERTPMQWSPDRNAGFSTVRRRGFQ